MVFLITLRKENFQTWLKKWQDRWGHHVQREQEYSGGLMEASLYSMSLHAWDWEDEDSESNGPASSYPSFYRFESDAEDYLRAPAHEPDFENPNSSIESFDASTFDPDVPRVVPCDLIISLALPANTDHKGKHTSLIDKYRKPPKSHNHMAKLRRFYHIEYFFLPDDEEPKKVDVVVFPGLARVFLESGIKTVRPWCEDDKLWVSWSQTFNVNVTKELLKKLNFHKIILRIWDTKDKISKKFQYCHPLKTLSDDLGSLEEVRHLVLNQRELSELALEKANVLREGRNEASLLEKQEKAEKGLKSLPAELETSSRNSKEYEKPLKADDLPTFRTSRASPTSFMGTTMMEIKELIDRTSFSSLNTLERPRSQIKGRDFEIKKKSHKRMKKPSAIKDRGSMVSGCWGQSALCIQLAVTPLLAGQQAVMSRGSEKSANILDCLLTLKTEVPIMTEEQKQDLNPMTIKIECASCLPSQPVPIQELENPQVPAWGVQGAVQLEAVVPPQALRRPGDRRVPRAPLHAHGTAHEAAGLLRAQRSATHSLPGAGQDLRHLPHQHPAQGGDCERPAAFLRHDQGLEPRVRRPHLARGPHRWKAPGLAAAARPQPGSLPEPGLHPDHRDPRPPGEVPAVAGHHAAEERVPSQPGPEKHQRSL
ncbi:uncharacterized protein KIAA1257 homolog isoform X4 [Fukomys damarensis]|uniref:uncharacterized protein KIAA1257 homolog isoform X4 n=1 Tax=Fukomys damarensis TaxID=885580 RepID=UPI001455142C|nr:uncharacterized protein KIAA1257 homolog isoform X4 [Fukomys damarensis]